jgi:hypothetical protein
VESVVDRAALRQAFSEYFRFPCHYSFIPLISLQLSPRIIQGWHSRSINGHSNNGLGSTTAPQIKKEKKIPNLSKHKIPPLHMIISKFSPVHILKVCFSKICSDTVFQTLFVVLLQEAFQTLAFLALLIQVIADYNLENYGTADRKISQIQM